MATVFDVWGFGKIVAIGPESSEDYLSRVQAAMHSGAQDRGIDPATPSDALDSSRDIILDEFLGAPWLIERGTLYVSYVPGVSAEYVRDHHAAPFLQEG